MKKLLKRVTALFLSLTAAAAFGISANAASIFEPYGYSLPIETLATDPDSLNDQNYISGMDGTRSYDEEKGFGFVPSTDSALFINLGGKNYAGNDFTMAPTAGKIVTKFTFSLKKSANPNQPKKPVEWLDFSNFYMLDGNNKSVGFNFYYAWNDYYMVNINGLNNTSIRSGNIYFGRFYTYTSEIDVTKGTAYQCIKQTDTGTIVGQLSSSGSIDAARNGAMARIFPMWDSQIKEFSCYRETFLVRNEKIEADENSVTAQMEVALDCSENAAYGKLNTVAPVLVLCQYDKNNRLLGYDIQKVTLNPKAVSAEANTYKTVTASAKKSRYYDHAAAYIWNNEDDMYAYREPLTIK